MLSNSKKSKIIDILLQHAIHDELLAVFQVMKVLVGRYGKKIYTPEVRELVAKENILMATALQILAEKDATVHLLPYINLIISKSNRNSIDLNEESHSLLYRDGDALYKRSLGRDLQKMLAKK